MSGVFGGPSKGPKGDQGSNSGSLAIGISDIYDMPEPAVPGIVAFPLLMPIPIKQTLGLPYAPEHEEPEISEPIQQRFGMLGYEAPTIVQDQPYNAGDFDTGSAMTWTVEAGDLLSFRYGIKGKLLYVSVFVVSSTIAGAVNVTLRVKIPGGYTSAKDIRIPVWIVNNGGHETGSAFVTPAGTLISIVRCPVANFTASANNTSVGLQMWIEVQ